MPASIYVAFREGEKKKKKKQNKTKFNFRYVGDSPLHNNQEGIYIFQFSWSLSQIHSNNSKREHAWTVCDAASFGGDEPSSEKIFLHTINTSGKC